MVMHMKILSNVISVAAALLIATACSPIPTTIPGLPAVNATDANSANPQSQLNPSTPDLDLPPTQGVQGQPPASGPVTIQITSPQDGATVNTPQVQVTGVSSPGAVVTVNDDILIAGPDGKFDSTVSLEDGLNLIEIVASNDSGSETSLELTVTYEP
jgi:glucodextranase-like protein